MSDSLQTETFVSICRLPEDQESAENTHGKLANIYHKSLYLLT